MTRPPGALACVATAAVAALLASGCTASERSSPSTPASASTMLAVPVSPFPEEAAPVLPVTLTDGSGRTVTVQSAERIVPLDGDLAEIVFALGLGDRVVATDLSASYPPEADDKPEIGYQRALAPEPVLATEPTVVLATPMAGPAEVVEQLRAAVPLVLVDAPATLDGPAAKIRAVGAALGVPGRAEQLARRTEAEIEAALQRVPPAAVPPRVAALYLRGGRVQQLFGPGSGIHALITAAGAIDVGAELGVRDNQPVTAEALVVGRPDLLLVTTTGLQSVGGVEGLLSLPAFSRTPAARNRRVIAFEDQYLYGLGPRTGALLAALVEQFHAPAVPAD